MFHIQKQNIPFLQLWASCSFSGFLITNYVAAHPMNIPIKFGSNWSSGICEKFTDDEGDRLMISLRWAKKRTTFTCSKLWLSFYHIYLQFLTEFSAVVHYNDIFYLNHHLLILTQHQSHMLLQLILELPPFHIILFLPVKNNFVGHYRINIWTPVCSKVII